MNNPRIPNVRVIWRVSTDVVLGRFKGMTICGSGCVLRVKFDCIFSREGTNVGNDGVFRYIVCILPPPIPLPPIPPPCMIGDRGVLVVFDAGFRAKMLSL